MSLKQPLHRLQYLLLCVIALLAFSNAAIADSWWNDAWTIRKKITVDAGSSGVPISGPVGSAAALVRLHDGNFQFIAAKEDAGDLRFVAADGKTLLTHHIEKYDNLLNEAYVWVKIPDVKPGEQTIFWLYYGNTGADATKLEDSKGTYDSDTVLVYHFNERGQPAGDSSGNGNSADNAGVAVEGALIGSGIRLDGKTSVTVKETPSLGWSEGAALTWSAWIKSAALSPKAVLFKRTDGGNSFVIGVNDGVPYVEVAGQRSAGGAPVAIDTWAHVAVVATGGQITLYLDGNAYGAPLAARLPALSTPLQIGATESGFNGELDELQISRSARTPGYIQFAAASQGGPKAAQLITLGNDEQTSSLLGDGYFAVIVKNLTFDGWLVIVILAVMLVISWWVMIKKFRYLQGVIKGNDLFMEEWRRISEDFTALEQTDEKGGEVLSEDLEQSESKSIRNSPIFRVYHIGAAEIRHRLALRAGQPKSLTSRGIQAIRARLDGSLEKERVKLNSGIVLLTIAISGGPFLGLLGTVVGVMITFAAVAQAGDVNVNAIAPGIAAALLATVAGLAVAIPALFGYNYLLSRIKEATSTLHVFIDEFVTAMAEFYRGGPAE